MTSSAPFKPQDPEFAERVRRSFTLQGAMQTLGAELTHVEAGAVDISFDWARPLTQQNGYLHAGMVATGLDSACGYAGYTLMPAEANVLTIEFKINLLAPAKGERFRMEGRVIKAGRTIVVTEGRAFAQDQDQGQERLVATIGCTLMVMMPRANH